MNRGGGHISPVIVRAGFTAAIMISLGTKSGFGEHLNEMALVAGLYHGERLTRPEPDIEGAPQADDLQRRLAPGSATADTYGCDGWQAALQPRKL